MSEHIVEDFWKNIKKNENLIQRCFKHHFRRHPDPDGFEASYNNLMVRMLELNVFERFELKKLVIAAKAEGLVGDKLLTPELLKSVGIDVGKKWEQFIYKWIEQIVNYEYNRNGKFSRTFIHGEGLSDYGVPKNDSSMWIEDRGEAIAYETKFNRYGEERRGRKFPPTFSNRYMYGEENFDNQFETTSAKEIREKIIKKLVGKNDLDIFKLVEKGWTEKDISEKLEFSKQYVGTVIRKIRSVTTQVCQELCV